MSRDRLLALATLAIATGTALLAAECVLSWWDQRIAASTTMDAGLLRYDARLGWTLSPHWAGRHRHHDFDVGYTVNALGFRGAFPEPDGPKRRPRIAVLGDSFTFGLGVEDDETFVARLARDDASHEWLNFAVPGYSPDQSLLQIEAQVMPFVPDEIWLAFYLGNDLPDLTRDYPLQADQAKPRFTLGDGRLMLTNVPVPRTPKPAALRRETLEDIVFGPMLERERTPLERWRMRSHLLGRLLPAQRFDRAPLEAALTESLSEASELLGAILSEMHRISSARIVVVILPGQSFVEQPDSPSALYQEHVRQRVLATASAIDIAAVMRQRCAAIRCFHPHDGHYTPAGHRVVSTAVLDRSREG